MYLGLQPRLLVVVTHACGYIVADGQTETVLLLKSRKLFAFAEGTPYEQLQRGS